MEELGSLVDGDNTDPALPTGHPFEVMAAGGTNPPLYWSSNTDSYGSNAWGIDIATGDLGDGIVQAQAIAGVADHLAVSWTAPTPQRARALVEPSPGHPTRLDGQANRRPMYRGEHPDSGWECRIGPEQVESLVGRPTDLQAAGEASQPSGGCGEVSAPSTPGIP